MSTAIQWTDETWNPTTGCTRVSEGCRHCYIERTPAFRMAGRKFENGKIPIILHHDRLEQPKHWKKPRRVFVNSLSDLFHEDVPFDFIHWVFATIRQTPQHTYQILTKRPARMLEVMNLIRGKEALGWANGFYTHVWLGVSVEDQKTADERIPLLLQTPAAVRFVSAEPLLGPVDLSTMGNSLDIGEGQPWLHPLDGLVGDGHGDSCTVPRIDWVIVGGESGPKARPCDIAWIRSVKDQCQAAGVPVFVKQLGAKPFEMGCAVGHTWIGRNPQSLHRIVDHKGGDMTEWPTDLRVRAFPRQKEG